MSIDRRTFVGRAAGAVGAIALGEAIVGAGATLGAQQAPPSERAVPDVIGGLKPMTSGVVPITDEERLARIEKARRLLVENGIGAMFIEGGSSLLYYTGVRWGNSERPFGVVIPARGELAFITPGFEEQRARELIKFTNDVRVWQEDESPYRLIANILRDRGIATGKVGVEERVRFFIADGIRKEAPQLEFTS